MLQTAQKYSTSHYPLPHLMTVHQMPYDRIPFGVRAYGICHSTVRQMVYGDYLPQYLAEKGRFTFLPFYCFTVLKASIWSL